jgi:glutamate dehydrogenase/leucine dehydrogenase
VYLILRSLSADLGRDPSSTSVAIQGYGNVGSWTAKLAAQGGYRIAAISDVHGGIRRDAGINIAALEAMVRDGGSLADYPGADVVSNDALLTMDVDVLIPAAIGCVITADNARAVRAPVIIEAANRPVTDAADELLSDRGVTVVPDILANAGGVIVSYFEWTQNIQQFRWDEARVNAELERIMTSAYQQVREVARERRLSLRRAAYRIAVARVAEAVELRGFV